MKVKIGTRNYSTSRDDMESLTQAALGYLESSHVRETAPLTTTLVTKNYIRLRLGAKPFEVASVMFLDTRNRLIEFREMFNGTIDSAPVYCREIVRACIETNAAAVILAHNHPSGDATPSGADKQITARVKDALALIDVRVLDHIVVSPLDAVSMAELGDM